MIQNQTGSPNVPVQTPVLQPGSQYASTAWIGFFNQLATLAAKLILTPQSFAMLPPASGKLEGTIAALTDSTTATWGATITGGGTNHVLAYCNGVHWTVLGK